MTIYYGLNITVFINDKVKYRKAQKKIRLHNHNRENYIKVEVAVKCTCIVIMHS